MTEDASRFVGSIPENYDLGMGPVMFAPYADITARRVASWAPGRVLETAAGTGILTQRLAAALAPTTRIVATDLNAPMLDAAARKLGSFPNVVLQPADATNLPFGEGEFDAAVCQFGVMFFPDKDRFFREAGRVLAPGGRILFSVWDALDHNPFAKILNHTLVEAFGIDPPPFLQVPFGYFAIDPIKASLLNAEFDNIRIEVVRLAGPIADFGGFARGLTLGSPLAEQIRSRGVDPEELVSLVEGAMKRQFGALGEMPLQAIIFEAQSG